MRGVARVGVYAWCKEASGARIGKRELTVGVVAFSSGGGLGPRWADHPPPATQVPIGSVQRPPSCSMWKVVASSVAAGV